MLFKFKMLFLLFLILSASFLEAQTTKYSKIDWPVIRGNISGQRMIISKNFGADATATDFWFIGDTTAAGAYRPTSAMEIKAVRCFWVPASGDSCRIIGYSYNGSGISETIFDTDTLVGTSATQIDSLTINSTYKTVTESEGLGVEFININGTPGIFDFELEFKLRNSDNAE